jgi:hypothetical protein
MKEINDETYRLMMLMYSSEELARVLEEMVGSWLIIPFRQDPYLGPISEGITQEGYIRRSEMCRLN